MAYSKKRMNEKRFLNQAREDEKCVSTIKTRISESKNFLSPYYNRWKEYEEIYRCVPDAGHQTYMGRANLYVPMGRSIVDRYHAKLTINRPKTSVVARRPEYVDGAMKLSYATDYYWDKGGFKKKYKTWVKDALKCGLGIGRLTWRKDDNYNGPWFDILDITNGRLFLDPSATSLEEIRWYAYCYDKSYEEIKDNKNYLLPEQDDYSDINNPVAYSYYENYRLYVEGSSPPTDSTFRKGKITEYVGLYNDGNGLENYLITILNDQYMIRKEKWSSIYKHNQLNLHFIVDNLLPHMLIPSGELEPIASLQYELNSTRNQRMDNVTNILHRMFVVSVAADIDDSELVHRPSGIIHAADINGIQALETPDVTASSYNEETMIKDDIRLVSQVDDRSASLGRTDKSAASTTVHGMAMQENETNIMAANKLDNIEDGLVSLGKQMVALIQQFMPDNLIIRITGDNMLKFKKISREEIQGEYDFTAEMGVTQPQNRQTRRGEARELVATIGPYLQVAGPTVLPKFKKALNYLINTYEIPEDEAGNELNEMEQANMMGQLPEQNAQPPILTPGQTGVPLEGMQQMYGQQGANLGGATNNFSIM